MRGLQKNTVIANIGVLDVVPIFETGT